MAACPAATPEEVLEDWLGRGPAIVAVTLGGDGVLAGTAAGVRTRRPGVPVTVVDTVGAGDTFSAALLAGLHRRGLLGAAARPALHAIDHATLDALLDEASLAAAITCSRRGADPPTAEDVEPRSGPSPTRRHQCTPHDELGRPIGRSPALRSVSVVLAPRSVVTAPSAQPRAQVEQPVGRPGVEHPVGRHLAGGGPLAAVAQPVELAGGVRVGVDR